MGFLTGSVTYQRFRVACPAPRQFDQEHLDKLADRMAGRQRLAAADGVETGWTAGDHIHDTAFTLDKNVVNDALCFELAVDTDKLPADKLKAYYQVELKANLGFSGLARPTAKMKRAAKETARERLEEEAKDGRYRKRKCVPVLWDRTTGEVLFGATSLTLIDRLCSLFEQTFGAKLYAVTAGRLAAEGDNRTGVDETLSAFVPGVTADEPCWIVGGGDTSFHGNEFLLWLWYWLDVNSDTLTLPDGSEATVMIARTLTLECPRGQTGHDTISHEGPTRLPEARRAIQSGKLPRKCGLTVVRHGQQYELTLSAETLAVSGAKLPPPDDTIADARGKAEDRVDSIRALVETLDQLYAAFLSRRLGREWADDLAGMQGWLSRKEHAAEAA